MADEHDCGYPDGCWTSPCRRCEHQSKAHSRAEVQEKGLAHMREAHKLDVTWEYVEGRERHLITEIENRVKQHGQEMDQLAALHTERIKHLGESLDNVISELHTRSVKDDAERGKVDYAHELFVAFRSILKVNKLL